MPGRRTRALVAAAVALTLGLAAAPTGAATPQPLVENRAAMAPLPLDNTFPIPAPLRSSYSNDWHACRDGCARLHQGNDVFADEGSPIVAVEGGVIRTVNNADAGKAGLSLWLLGDSGNAYFYAHNSANLVTAGQHIARGETIALVGHTGNPRTTASHIHFQINRCGKLTSDEPCTVNPYDLLRSWSQELIDGGADAIGWFEPSSSTFHLRAEGGSPLAPVALGRPGDIPLALDWDGDGRDTLAVYRPADDTFYFRDAFGSVLPIAFGVEGTDIVPLTGDWDGDGRDSLALYRRDDATLHLHDDLGTALPPLQFGLPSSDVVPLSGDWNGDHRDGLALFRRSDATFLLFDDVAADGAVTPPTSGSPWPVPFGDATDFPLVGDWDGDGRDSIGVYHPADSTYHLDGFTNLPPPATEPAAEVSPVAAVPTTASGVALPGGPITFGLANVRGAVPLAGDWNGRDVVSLDELSALFGATVHPLVLIANLPSINAAMIKSGAVTPARKAAFLATISNESGLRADAVQDDARRYRGRGFIQLTGVSNYRKAGTDLGLDLVDDPDLAAQPLASALIASWFWTVARNINVAADRLDMAAVNIAIGYAPNLVEDFERCASFLHALTWFSGGALPTGVNCERNATAAALARTPNPRARAATPGPAPSPRPVPPSAPAPLPAPTPPAIAEPAPSADPTPLPPVAPAAPAEPPSGPAQPAEPAPTVPEPAPTTTVPEPTTSTTSAPTTTEPPTTAEPTPTSTP